MEQSPVKKKRKKIMMVIWICLAVAVLGLIAAVLYGNYRTKQLATMSYEEMLAYDTKNDPNARITVGVLQNGKASYTVYGQNGTVLPEAQHTYEIGSLTKTFTAALIARGVQEGKIDLQNRIDAYLPLPEGQNYPTVSQLLTHTSGYRSYYFEAPMTANTLGGKNTFYQVTRGMVLDRLSRIRRAERAYPFSYSNFGFAVLGLILEEVYQRDYTALINAYVQDTLGLANTRVSDGRGDLGRYWDWAQNDAYIPAGALLSNAEDMLRYAALQMDGEHAALTMCQRKLADIEPIGFYTHIGIGMNGVGMSWMLDEANHIVWHNGGTSYYNSYLGFDPQRGIAVAVLSNLPPNQKIPATVIGPKLLAGLQG